MPPPLTQSIAHARNTLSAFIRRQAAMRQERLGFAWRASLYAPSSYDALQQEYQTSVLSGLSLRVSAAHNDPVIYDCPETNLAFRFWHDTGHVLHGLSFDLDDELELAMHHLEALRAEGFGPGSLEHGLLHADTFGQAYFTVRTGCFVGDQLRFGLNCITRSVEEAVNDEAAHLLLQDAFPKDADA